MDYRHLNATDRLEALRSGRTWPGRTGPLSDVLGPMSDRMRRRSRALGAAGKAWCEVVPEDLAASAVLVGVRSGVLTVRVPGAGDRFRLDRWLRAGGLNTLRRSAATGLRQVKIVTS